MATYNGEKYIRKQLDSIFNQTYTNIEVIVTDDCSTDATIDILEEYAQKFGLKYFINRKNLGFVKNFETALLLCRGDYIALADQDDIWEKNKLEILINNINDSSLICSDLSIIDENDIIKHQSFRNLYNFKDYYNNRDFIKLCFRCFALGCCTLFKKELLTFSIPFPDCAVSHDWWIALIAEKKGGIKYIDDKLVHHREHEKNISNRVTKKSLFSYVIKFFDGSFRNKKITDFCNLRNALIMALNCKIELSEPEEACIKECIRILDNFINKDFNFNTINLYFKHKKYFFNNSNEAFYLILIFYCIVSLMYSIENTVAKNKIIK